MSDVQAAIAKAEFPAKAQVLFQPESSRYRVMYGGRGGAKSWAAARALLIKGAKTPLRILCAREYQTSIKDSVHKLLCDQIIDLELTSFYETTQAAIRGRNGTEFAFVGLKNNVANVKSFEGIDICWVEEAQTVSRNSWNVLIPTIRKEGSEIWITFNPELETDETYQRFVVKPPANAVVQKINWSDNPWFPETLRIEKESLRERDIQAYNQVWEGMCRQTVDGAIFATEMQRAEADGRITRVPYDPIKPVHAVWDLGWSDQTAIWFLQFVGMETRLINYLEDSQKTVNHYLQELQKKGYVYDTLWLPHDAENKTLAGNGRTIEELVKTAGYKTQILPKVPVVDSINAARTLFANMWFDRENCADGLTCLRHYRYDVDPDTGMFSRNPRHDQYSHGADAFRYIALMLRDKPKPRPKREVAMAASWMQ